VLSVPLSLRLIPVVLGIVICPGFAVAADTGLKAVWTYAAESQPTEARAALAKAGMVDPREQALAEMVLAFARPPVPEGELQAMERRLAELARGDDDLAARALYLQGRVHQVHSSPPRPERAAALYRELARRQPQSHWAQLGLVKLGLLQLYMLPEPAEAGARLAATAALLPRIAEPPLRRDLQLQIGWAALDWGRPLAEVLPHLIAAESAGGLLGMTAEDLVVQIGELSFRSGDYAQARRFFVRFLDEFPTNTRRFNVRQRLAEAEARLAAAGPAEGAQ